MISISAIIRAKPEHAATLRRALQDVVAHATRDEPGTLGYFVAQDLDDAGRFTTYERYADRAAMERHNASAAVAQFFAIAKPLLAGEVILVTAEEFGAKG